MNYHCARGGAFRRFRVKLHPYVGITRIRFNGTLSTPDQPEYPRIFCDKDILKF